MCDSCALDLPFILFLFSRQACSHSFEADSSSGPSPLQTWLQFGMEDSETELAVTEPDALGADFITVELDTQPIEYVVKWAEVGSKFTISCVKKDSDDPSDLTADQLKIETDEAFFAPYEEVYPCEVTEQSVEIKTDSDEEEEEAELLEEAGSSLLDGEAESDQDNYEPDERQYRCSYCGKCYSHASSLYRHQQTHTGKNARALPPAKRALEPAPQDARYTCPHCGMSFKGSRSTTCTFIHILLNLTFIFVKFLSFLMIAVR